MLVESIVRRTLELKRHCVERVKDEKGKLAVYLIPDKRSKLICSGCHERAPGYDTLSVRRWKHVPLWGIPVELVYAPRRVECRACGVKLEEIPWAQGKSPLSIFLSVVLGTWAKLVAWQGVGRIFGFHWNTVRKAVRDLVEYGFKHRDLTGVGCLGIDEVSRRKGHIYHTQVYDLRTPRLLWSGEERKSESLERFFKELGESIRGTVDAVCCDKWAPYIEGIKKRFPNALLVFDKFHIVRHLMEAVDKVRKEEARKFKDKGIELLKGTKYIWLKNPWNLTDKQRVRLSELEKVNLKTHRAYLLKEAFRKFWDYTYPASAEKYLRQWFWWATHSRLEPMRDFAWTLRKHQEQILNYFHMRITNATVEGLNNKAKAISHRAYGYRTAETFKLALYHGLGNLPEPQLAHRFV